MSQVTEFSFSNFSSSDTGSLPRTIRLSSKPIVNADFEASGKRGAAILMLFCSPLVKSESDNSHLVFIRRSTSVRTHKGQISFPGGRCEPQDTSPEETAMRETVEEVGIERSDIVIAGQLPPIAALDNSIVVPVVGVLNEKHPVFRPDPEEVDYVFTAPWTDFKEQASIPFQFNLFGNWRQSHLFESSGHRIWGLTASIIHSAAMG